MITHKLEKRVILYRQQYEDLMVRTFGSYVIDRSSMDLDAIMFRIKYMKKHNKDLDKIDDLKNKFSDIAKDMKSQFSDLMFELFGNVFHIDTSGIKEILANDVEIDQNYIKFTLVSIGDKSILEEIDNLFPDNKVVNIYPDKYFRFNTDSYNDGIAKAYPELFEAKQQHKVGTGDDEDVFVHSFTFQSSERCSLNCFPKGTEILMSDFSRKDISKIRVGDEVLCFEETLNNAQRSLLKTKVRKVSSRKEKCIKLSHPMFNKDIVVTPEHPFLTDHGWVNAKDIKPYYSIYMTKFDSSAFKKADVTSSKYIHGYFLTALALSGNIKKGKYRLGYKKFTGDHHIIFPCRDHNVYKRMKLYAKLFKIKFEELTFKINQNDKLGTKVMYIGNKEEYNKLMNLLVDIIYIGPEMSNVDFIMGCTAAAIDVNGYMNANMGKLKISNVKRDFIQIILNGLSYLDIDYECEQVKRKDSWYYPCCYNVSLNNKSEIVKLLYSSQTISSTRSLENMIGKKSLFKKIKDVSIDSIDNDIVVYNFETDAHTYIAEDILVHNCTYCVTPETKILMNDFTEKPIKDINIGDKILAFEEFVDKNKQRTLIESTVENIFINDTNEIYDLSSDSNTKSISITGNHSVLTNHDWKKINEMNLSDEIYDIKCSFDDYDMITREKLGWYIGKSIFEKSKVIINKRYLEHSEKVYNIQTSTRTYIANGYLVHNCYQFQKSEMRMNFNTAKLFIDHLLNDDYGYINRYNSPAIILEFIGGEPLLEIDLTRRIYEYFLDKCYELNHPWFTMHRLSICSNGLQYFDPDVQQFFKDYSSQISFNISIDGNKELHDSCRIQPNEEGSYDIDIMALNHYNKHYTSERNSKMTLAPSNIGYLYDSVVSFIENGMSVININCVFEEGWEPKHALIEYQNLKRLSNYILENDLEHIYIAIFNERQEDMSPPENDSQNCGGSGAMLSMRPNGDFYPCIRYMPSSVGKDRDDYSMGNVNTGMVGRNEGSEVLKRLDRLSRRSSCTDICFECPLSNDCFSCIALSATVYNNPDRRTTFACIMVIAESLANVYHWNMMLIKHPDWGLHPRRIVVPDQWALLIIDEEELDYLKKIELLAMITYMERQ